MSSAIQIEHLTRGGIIIRSESESLQYAAPPETIKDTQKRADGVPLHYLIPQQMFDIRRGISLADMEFPVYYNFFHGGRKTVVICTENQRKRLQRILKEALFGPDNLSLSKDFMNGWIPDLEAEIRYFRRHPFRQGDQMNLSDLVQFKVFKDREMQVGRLHIRQMGDGTFDIIDPDGNKVHLSHDDIFTEHQQSSEVSYYSFRQPIYGITILGAGDGFNPDSITSGMIVWVNRRGIIVDPPVNTTERLARLGVSPKLIDSVILTHCHSDHDAGTIQQLMQEGRLNLYTTQTIFSGFLRKITALTCIEKDHLRKMVSFHPVKIDKPERIGGAEFRFQYNLHSIPTISFRVSLHGIDMVYSSDTQNDPDFIERMYEEGIIDEKRRDQLLDFPWDCDVVFHEAGSKPLHTPIEFLCNLPANVRSNMYLLHTDLSRIPPDSGLRIAPTGLANTILLDVGELPHDASIEVLDVLAHMDIFRELPIEKAREILIYIKRQIFMKSDIIHKKGDPAHYFSIILHGAVRIEIDGHPITTLSKGDFFGEKSLILDRQHSADAIALTDVELLSFERDDFFSLVQGTDILETLEHLARIQNRELWHLVERNPIFVNLTPTQINHLHRLFSPEIVRYPEGKKFIRQGDIIDSCYVIRKGEVQAMKDGQIIDTVTTGEIIGVTALFDPEGRVHHGFRSVGDVELYAISRKAMIEYVEKYPGAYARLYYSKYIQNIPEGSCS